MNKLMILPTLVFSISAAHGESSFSLSADACNSRDTALTASNNNDVESDLSAESLSCVLTDRDTEYVYSIKWSGDDFDLDGSKDTLSFDVKVEAFEGSTFNYSSVQGESSVTELGSETSLAFYTDSNDTETDNSDDLSVWDIPGDTPDGLAESQSLRFSIENIELSTSGYHASFNGFSEFDVMETDQGFGHQHIRGFGELLDSGTFKTPKSNFSFDTFDELIVTGAGDHYSWKTWGITDLLFSFDINSVADSDDSSVEDSSDSSTDELDDSNTDDLDDSNADDSDDSNADDSDNSSVDDLDDSDTNDSGRNSYFWVELKANACTSLAESDDLVLSNGYRSVDLDSSDLSCTREDYGSYWIYEITWTGNSLLENDGIAETLVFDVRVEAFTDVEYVYSATDGESSVTAISDESTPSDTDGYWAVDDNDIDAGESIRMTMENFTVDGSDFSEKGLELTYDNFTTLYVLETNAGFGHKIIFGEGENLSSASFNAASSNYDMSDHTFTVTGAGSNVESRQWAISQIDFSFVVKNSSILGEDSDYPFADFEGGEEYGETPYEPTTQGKLDSAFPQFSWDHIPRMTLIRKSTAYTDAEIESMANTYDVVVLEKANSAGYETQFIGMRDTTTRLKEVNPDIKVLFYWNSRIYYGHYDIDDAIEDNYDDWIDPDYTIRDWPTFNRDNEDFIDWWASACHKMMGVEEGESVGGTPFAPSNIDGTFIDKKGVPVTMLEPLYKGATDDKLIMNNNGDDRDRIAYVDGTYREGWAGSSDEIAFAIALAQETGKNKKLTMLRNPTSDNTSEREMEDDVDFVLGVYLMYADEYAYFYHQQTVNAKLAQYLWLTNYYDHFRRPLGEPQSDALRDAYVYSRSFAHVDAYIDIDPDLDTKVGTILWKNNIGNPSLAGSGHSDTDANYTLQGSGDIADDEDSFFYLSDLHYGDGEVIASIDSLESSHTNAKAGIMFRERVELDDSATEEEWQQAYQEGSILISGASMVAVVQVADGSMQMLYRANQNGSLITAGTADIGPYAKLVRVADSFTGYSSADGETWTEIAEVIVSLDERVEMGMVVASGDDETLAEAVFSHFSREEGLSSDSSD